MAKQAAKKGVFSISDLDTYLTKDVNPHGSLIEDNKYVNNQTFISTGIYILDAAISTNVLGGGIPSNKMTVFAGLSGTGKTFLALNIAKNAQKQGYFIIYLDSEGAIDINTTKNFGIDPKFFRIDPIVTVEQFKVYMAKLLKKLEDAKEEGSEIPKMMIVLDSLGNLASEKEVTDAEDGESKGDMGGRTKVLKSLFRIIINKLNILSIPLICIAHTYQTMEIYSQERVSGGSGPIYNASVIMMLSKAKLKTGEEDDYTSTSGIIVTARADKNRLAKPKKVKFEIVFAGGSCNPYLGLDQFLIPENFKVIGIAKGKPVKKTDEITGEITVDIQPGGNFWYVRHLDKSFTTKNLFTEKIFTQDILEKINNIAHDYFRYHTSDEQSSEIEEVDEEDNTKTINNTDLNWLED